jgi:OFA family oxalate/formate antiporter-like MFS transporter
MMAIANLQYTWTLFTIPLSQGLHAKLSDVQLAFTLFILTQSWLVPIEGYLVDRLGAPIVVFVGGLLVGLSWVGSGLAGSLPALYVCYILGGIGVGAVYGACVGAALKWFSDRRGLAAGLVVGAYGSGAALTVIPLQRLIEGKGYQAAFITGGIVQGIVVMALAGFMTAPPRRWHPRRPEKATGDQERARRSAVSFTPLQMVKTGAFCLMYVMSTLVTFGGLVVTSQLKPIAAAYGLDKTGVVLGINALALALMLNLILSGLTRPFWGWVSDRIGRYRMMAVAFGMGALSILALLELVHHPTWFVAFSGMTVFAWGATFVLFSAAIGDVFGSRFATTNNGILYTSKGVASIFAGWGAARLLEETGSWNPVLWLAAAGNLVAAVLAFVWLRCLVTRLTAGTTVGPGPDSGTA